MAGGYGPGGPAADQPSTRFFSPFSARSMMTFSALRLIMPIIGILQVDGEPVGHLGRRRPPGREHVGAVHRLEHLALDQVPAQLGVADPVVLQHVVVLDRPGVEHEADLGRLLGVLVDLRTSTCFTSSFQSG